MGETGGQASPPRVLVVDDEPAIRLLCRVNLELDGYEVLEAETLGEARARLAEERVDIVLLDLNLRGHRSDDLVAECHARRPPVSVVLVTGSAEPARVELADADAILAKPFDLPDLLVTVRELSPARVGR